MERSEGDGEIMAGALRGVAIALAIALAMAALLGGTTPPPSALPPSALPPRGEEEAGTPPCESAGL